MNPQLFWTVLSANTEEIMELYHEVILSLNFKDSHELTGGPLKNMSRDLNFGESHLKGRAAERQRRQSH